MASGCSRCRSCPRQRECHYQKPTRCRCLKNRSAKRRDQGDAEATSAACTRICASSSIWWRSSVLYDASPNADPQFEIGGVTEVAAGLPECPALFIRTDQGVCTRLSDFHKRDDRTAAGGACARHRSEAATARCTQGVDEETADAHATHPY